MAKKETKNPTKPLSLGKAPKPTKVTSKKATIKIEY
jgi:hypothetical protein